MRRVAADPVARGGRACSRPPRATLGARDPLGLAEAGAVRFNEFKQALDGIPPRTLAARLVELENAGVLERQVVPDARPPRVEYRLTTAGRRLGALVDAMRAYASQA